MKSILSVKITDKGRHWHKEIRVFGVLVYHRHDYIEENQRRAVGFNTMPYAPIDIDEDWEEEYG